MADAGLLEQVIVDVDLDARLTCDLPAGCDEEAAWMYQCPTCPMSNVLCDRHHEEFVAHVAATPMWARYLPAAECKTCGYQVSTQEIIDRTRPI